MAETVRINTRISKTLNDWLDKRSEETGLTKSTLVFLALEQYMSQTEVIGKMGDMTAILQKLEQLDKKINKPQCPKCKEGGSSNSVEFDNDKWHCHECGTSFNA